MKKNKAFRKASVWSVLSLCSLGCSFYTLYQGIDKLTNYYNSENYPSLNVNVYVGGDAYNYIINGTYATAFFVLTTMFVLAAIGLMILHYVAKEKTVSPPQVIQKNVIEDIESNLPEM